MALDKRALPTLSLVLLTGVLGACHLIYPFDHNQVQDAAPPDQRADNRPDLPFSDVLTQQDQHVVPDAALPTLSCSAPVELTSADGQIESAFSEDGQILYAQQRGSPYGLRCLKRKDPQLHDLETSWSPCLKSSSGNFDLNFYKRAGVTRLLTSRWLSGARRIYRCAAEGTGCTILSAISPTLVALDDLDGPDIREVLRQDGVEEIYASYQTPPPPKVPTVTNLVVLVGNGVTDKLKLVTLSELNSSAREDDPSVLPDGSLIVFSSDRGGDEDLYYAVRKQGSTPPQFYPPQKIPGVNTSAPENGPEVDLTTLGNNNTKLELVFSRMVKKAGKDLDQIYYTTCTLQ